MTRTGRAQKGQSLIEMTLLLPLMLLLVLAAGEFGLALREQTMLQQATQQAAQYLKHHPAVSTSLACTHYLQPPYRSPASTDMDNTAYSQCTADIITSYLKAHGFPSSAVSAAVTFSSVTNQQIDTITVTYPYQIVLPIIDRINLCQGSGYPSGSVCLGARVATIAAVEAPSGVTVSHGSDDTYNQAQISWTPPYNPAGVILQYNVYSHPCECAADVAAPPNTIITTSSTSSRVTVVDQCAPVACDLNHYYYEVAAVQPETVSGAAAGVGLESPRAGAAGPPP